MKFVDKALARRLESAEEMPQVDCARMLQKLRPKIGAAFEPFCGGHVIFAGLNSPIGHAAGLGFDAALTAADLDRLEAFYRSHGAPAQLDLCPLTDPSVLELVSKRRYALAELNNVLYCPLSSPMMADVPPDVSIQRGIFALFGAGTLPEFRNRGIQTALLRTRLKAAAQAGCEYAVVITRGGTISERNCLRLGFRIAYSKATVIKHWDSA